MGVTGTLGATFGPLHQYYTIEEKEPYWARSCPWQEVYPRFLFPFNNTYSLGPLPLVEGNGLLGGMGEKVAKQT